MCQQGIIKSGVKRTEIVSNMHKDEPMMKIYTESPHFIEPKKIVPAYELKFDNKKIHT